MTGIAYLAAITAMLWLGFWLVQGKRAEKRPGPARRSKLRWWPFEYRTHEVTNPKAVEQPELSGWRSRAATNRHSR